MLSQMVSMNIFKVLVCDYQLSTFVICFTEATRANQPTMTKETWQEMPLLQL